MFNKYYNTCTEIKAYAIILMITQQPIAITVSLAGNNGNNAFYMPTKQSTLNKGVNFRAFSNSNKSSNIARSRKIDLMHCPRVLRKLRKFIENYTRRQFWLFWLRLKTRIWSTVMPLHPPKSKTWPWFRYLTPPLLVPLTTIRVRQRAE